MKLKMNADTAREVAQQHNHNKEIEIFTKWFKEVDKNFDSCRESITAHALSGHYDSQCFISRKYLTDKTLAQRHEEYRKKKIEQLQRDGFEVTPRRSDVHIKVSW